jgi:hypothetical protein
VKELTLSPTTAIGNKTVVTGTVTLNGPAPSGGSYVNLTSSDFQAALVPAIVKVLSGQTSVKFQVTTFGVPSDTSVVIQALLGSSSQNATLTIQAPTLVSLTIRPTTVKGSSSAETIGMVTISSKAPESGLGFVLTLTSSNPNVVSVPVSVFIDADRTSTTFTITHYKVTAKTTVQISTTFGTVTKSATLTVTP